MNLDYVYLPFQVKPNDLESAIAGFTAIGLQGFNITIPHKQAIISLLENVSDVAKAVGAVNTVWRTHSGWSGTNTDVEGFLAPLQTLNWAWDHRTVVILGNGGAARAVVVGCSQLGFTNIQIVGRDPQKLQTFQQSWGNFPLPLDLQIYLQAELPTLIPQADLLVNTTPIGMYPHVNESPVSDELMALMPPGAIAYDLIYSPSPTLFLEKAQKNGATLVDGLEMLIHQGAAALKIWVQHSIPLEVMRLALYQHLGL
jgi:shikimate dehydrogenase